MIMPQLCFMTFALCTCGAIIWLRRQFAVASVSDAPEAHSLSPLELSYLLDGTRGFARALLLIMARKGWLIHNEDQHVSGMTSYFAPCPTHPPTSLLQAAEYELWITLEHSEDPVAMPALLSPGGLVDNLRLFGAQMQRDLAAHGMMYSLERCQRHDARRQVVGSGVAMLGVLMSAALAPTSVVGALVGLGVTWGAWRMLHHLTMHPRRTPSGDLIVEVYHSLYEPMYTRRETWRRFTPRDFDYLQVIFSRA